MNMTVKQAAEICLWSRESRVFSTLDSTKWQRNLADWESFRKRAGMIHGRLISNWMAYLAKNMLYC